VDRSSGFAHGYAIAGDLGSASVADSRVPFDDSQKSDDMPYTIAALNVVSLHHFPKTMTGGSVHIFREGIPIMALAFACVSAVAQESPDPFNILPSHNPLALLQLAALDDVQFQGAILENNGERLRTIVASFDPPGLSVFPVSHGFARAKEACLSDHITEACRLYVIDLLAVQQRKLANASVANNPFAIPAP